MASRPPRSLDSQTSKRRSGDIDTGVSARTRPRGDDVGGVLRGAAPSGVCCRATPFRQRPVPSKSDQRPCSERTPRAVGEVLRLMEVAARNVGQLTAITRSRLVPG